MVVGPNGTETVSDSVLLSVGKTHTPPQLLPFDLANTEPDQNKQIQKSLYPCLVSMLSAADEVINVLLLSLQATFSCLFCFHPGSPLCVHGKLSHRKQKLIVCPLSAATSLCSYPFVRPLFTVLWDIAAGQKTPVLGFR